MFVTIFNTLIIKSFLRADPKEKPAMQIPIKPTESFQKKEDFTMPKVQKKTYTPQEWSEFYDSMEYLDDVKCSLFLNF